VSLTPAVRDAALRWIADDPDPATRTNATVARRGTRRRPLCSAYRYATPGCAGAASVVTAVAVAYRCAEQRAAEELAERMTGPLTFGTAGLRGPVRRRPAGMNVAVVTRATAGLAAWLAGRGHGGGLVVVGRDARTAPPKFARATAEVFARPGSRSARWPSRCPTPLLAYSVRTWGAVAAVQITASHNPAADNGYKVTSRTARKLVEPADAQIEAAIAQPLAGPIGTHRAGRPDRPRRAAGRLPGSGGRAAQGHRPPLRIALTPLHGVGARSRCTRCGAPFRFALVESIRTIRFLIH